MLFLQAIVALTAQFFAIAALGMIALQTASQPPRTLLLGLIWSIGIGAFNTFRAVIRETSALASVVGLFILIWILHLTQLLWVENHIISDNTAISRSHAAYKMLFNVRKTALIPELTPERDQRDASGVRGAPQLERRVYEHRRQFRTQQIRQGLLLLSSFIAYSTVLPAVMGPMVADGVRVWQPDSGTLSFAEQLRSDLALRVLLVADFILTTYMLDCLFHSLFAVLFVNILRLDVPKEWPALWGSIVDTTSIRDFWARFWHKLVQYTLLGLACGLVRPLGVKPRSAAGRLLTSGMVFLLSGAVHGVTTWRLGFRCGWWADMAWFGAQLGMIMMEDVVASRAKRVLGMRVPSRASATMGYIWTWGFMLYSIPKMQFAKMQCGIENDTFY